MCFDQFYYMTKQLKIRSSKAIFRIVRRKLALIMIACMLGISNVILQEERMVNDTRAKIEQQEIQSEDD